MGFLGLKLKQTWQEIKKWCQTEDEVKKKGTEKSPRKFCVSFCLGWIYIWMLPFLSCCRILFYISTPLIPNPLQLQLSPSGDEFRFTKNRQSFPPIEQRWWSPNLTFFLEAFYCLRCFFKLIRGGFGFTLANATPQRKNKRKTWEILSVSQKNRQFIWWRRVWNGYFPAKQMKLIHATEKNQNLLPKSSNRNSNEHPTSLTNLPNHSRPGN